MKRNLLWLAAAAAGGVLWGLCFGRDPWLLVPWAALVPLVLLLSLPRRLSLAAAWVHGMATWLTAVPWLLHTLTTFGGLPGWLGAVLLLLLAAYLGSYHLAFVAFGRIIWRLGPGAVLFALPALWVSLEWLRGVLVTGFPWNLAAYAWADVPGALPLTAWIGSYGISYLLLMANVGLALGVLRRSWGHAALGLLLPLLLLAAGGRWATGGGAASPPVTMVRVIQPNIPNLMDFDSRAVEENYRSVFDLSRRACDHPGALVIWPESAGWPYEFSPAPGVAGRLHRDLEGLATAGCGVLFNSSYEERVRGHEEDVHTYNSAYLLAPDGSTERYNKRHLVPWGEYVLLADVLPFVGKIARQAGNFTAGHELRLLPWQGEQLGVTICYEAIFPAAVAEQVRQGATVLVTISNDAWYGDSVALWQHFRAARFRAAENRRPMVRAAITGISGVIAADGRVLGRLLPGERGILPVRLGGRTDLSPYSRHPGWIPGLNALLAAFAILAGFRKPYREEPRHDFARNTTEAEQPG